MSDNAANLIESLQAELDSREEYSVCDCCECLTTDPVDAGGHIQCPSCTKVANLEHERDRYREALELWEDIPCEDQCPSLFRETDLAYGECSCFGGKLRRIARQALKEQSND